MWIAQTFKQQVFTALKVTLWKSVNFVEHLSHDQLPSAHYHKVSFYALHFHVTENSELADECIYYIKCKMWFIYQFFCACFLNQLNDLHIWQM